MSTNEKGPDAANVRTLPGIKLTGVDHPDFALSERPSCPAMTLRTVDTAAEQVRAIARPMGAPS